VAYRSVPGHGLRTRWDDQPVVLITNHRDTFGTLELSWATEPVSEHWVPRRTRVVFEDVVEYRWRYWDVGERAGREEGGLELGELEDSDRVTALVQQGFDSDLRHFRISFDEHGRYEVICRRIQIEYETRRPATPSDDSGGHERPAGYYPSVAPAPSMIGSCGSRSTPWTVGWCWSAWRAGGRTRTRPTSTGSVLHDRRARRESGQQPSRMPWVASRMSRLLEVTITAPGAFAMAGTARAVVWRSEARRSRSACPRRSRTSRRRKRRCGRATPGMSAVTLSHGLRLSCSVAAPWEGDKRRSPMGTDECETAGQRADQGW
jgi:hypothetical protein